MLSRLILPTKLLIYPHLTVFQDLEKADYSNGDPGSNPGARMGTEKQTQVGSESSQSKARQRRNTLQRSPALTLARGATSDGTRNTPGRLPAVPSLPREPFLQILLQTLERAG